MLSLTGMRLKVRWYGPIRMALALVVLVAAGCIFQVKSVQSQAASVRVVTSISPIADVIRNVGGDRVDVVALVPVGDGPERYDPTPADAAAVSRARVFFANGLGLEEYLTDLIDSTGSQIEVVTLSEGLSALGGFGQGGLEGGNPHLWLNPLHTIRYAQVVRDTLSRIDPAGADLYAARAQSYFVELAELDRYLQQQVQTIPPSGRVLVSTHDAFPYFADRYGLTYLAVISSNPDSDPTAQEYAQLVRLVRDNGVKAVFGETGFSDRFISQLAADTGARYVADLYTDTLSEGPPAAIYVDAMRYNAEAVVGGLR